MLDVGLDYRRPGKCGARGMHGLVRWQSVNNPKNRVIEPEAIPACTGYGMCLIPCSPVDGGMLTGAVEKERDGRRGGTWVTDQLERDREKIATYEDLCRRIGRPPAQVTAARLLHQPAITAPIVGPRTLAQLEDAVAATDIRLDAATLTALDRIFPGPGGAAPEACARRTDGRPSRRSLVWLETCYSAWLALVIVGAHWDTVLAY